MLLSSPSGPGSSGSRPPVDGPSLGSWCEEGLLELALRGPGVAVGPFLTALPPAPISIACSSASKRQWPEIEIGASDHRGSCLCQFSGGTLGRTQVSRRVCVCWWPELFTLLLLVEVKADRVRRP